MNQLIYIPITMDLDFTYLESLMKQDSIRTISFSSLRSSDITFNLSTELYNLAATNLILELCLAISTSEAYGVTDLYIPIFYSQIEQFSDKTDMFVACIKKLAKKATLKKIRLHFPFDTEVDENVEYDMNFSLNPFIPSPNASVITIFSGGLDCTVASSYLHQFSLIQHHLFYNYGQNNLSEEMECAFKQFKTKDKLTDSLLVDNILYSFFINITFSSPLLSKKYITVEKITEEYVPFRNSIFIARALEYAMQNNSTFIVTGSHLDDRNSPDNSPEFYSIWQSLLDSTKRFRQIRLLPILFKIGGKKEVVKLGNELGVDFCNTWTCHNSSENSNKLIQCGECNDCITRRRSFYNNGLTDPLEYKRGR